MNSGVATPQVALVLGIGGLVPFVAGAIAVRLGLELPIMGGAHMGLAVYAVAILSFLSGVRWGLAMGYDNAAAARRDFVISVLPALIGWAAFFLPAPRDLWTLAGAFLALGLLDYGLTCRTIAPEWYGQLRLGLTAVVTLALSAAAWI